MPVGIALLVAGVATYAFFKIGKIALGVPEAGRDYRLGDTFLHEANYDQLNGVSFSKGCFIGQEVAATAVGEQN